MITAITIFLMIKAGEYRNEKSLWFHALLILIAICQDIKLIVM